MESLIKTKIKCSCLFCYTDDQDCDHIITNNSLIERFVFDSNIKKMFENNLKSNTYKIGVENIQIINGYFSEPKEPREYNILIEVEHRTSPLTLELVLNNISETINWNGAWKIDYSDDKVDDKQYLLVITSSKVEKVGLPF